MNTLLLDTHIWIWYLSAAKALKPRIRRLLDSDDTRLLLSPFSIWEAQMLGEIRRIEMSPSPQAWINDALERLIVEDAPFTRAAGKRLLELSFEHADPIDRFLAATSIVLEAPLVTADKNLLSLQWLTTIDARK